MVTDRLTPNSVVQGLLGLARELAELSKDLDTIEADAVNKREDLTLASAKAFLSAEGPVETRKAVAITETHEERLAAELAEALVRGRRRQIESLRIRIDVGRSAAAALRAEMDLTR
jgi:hypothetical protein